MATALATITALGVAVWNFWQRNKDERRRLADDEQRDAERRDLEAAQARSVLVSVRLETHDDQVVPVVEITNYSTQPILDLDIVGATITDAQGLEWKGVLFSHAWPTKGGIPLGPGETWHTALNIVFQRDGSPNRQAIRGDKCAITYQYLDDHGLRWEREANYQPRRITQDPDHP